MRTDGFMAALVLLVVFAVGCALGVTLAKQHLRPQIDRAVKQAVEQSNIAKGWQSQYNQVYPLVTQWRLGYEGLKASCVPK